MLAVDTNVLIRALVDDPGAPDQCRTARRLLAREGRVHVTQLVQAELVWVLLHSMRHPREAVIGALAQLEAHPAVQLQSPDAFSAALEAMRKGFDFADALIAAEAARMDLRLVTFDRKFARHPGVLLLSAQLAD